MPAAVIASIAKKSGKSKSDIEKIWDEEKKHAKKKFKTEDEHYWAYVTAVTKRRSGLKESLTFKGYLCEVANKKEEPIEKIDVGDQVEVIKSFKVGENEVSVGETFTVSGVADDGAISLSNPWGPEQHDKFFSVKNFKKIA
jgi:hypothetical protein